MILRGTLAYADKLFSGDNPEVQLIEYAKKHLKEDGKLLLAVDNKIGIRNYSEIQQKPKDGKKLTRKQIEELLETTGLKYYKFYYPLPDCEITNVIFTDKFLPNQETIVRNISLHEKEDVVIQLENKLFLDLLEQDKNLFKLFANSYLIECSRQEFPDNQIEFVSFSNMRKPEYSIKTIIQGDKVYKTAMNEQAKSHIEDIKKNLDVLNQLGFRTLDSYEEDVIISQYQKEKETLDNIIIHQIKSGKKEEAIQLITRFFQEIKEKLNMQTVSKNILDEYEIPYETNQIENLTFTKYGLWDLIFQNAFYMDDQFFFYDQEWIEEGVPIEYIFYRSMEYTRGLKEMLAVEEIYQKFGISEQQLNLFLQLDNKLQEKTRNQQVWDKHVQMQTINGLKAEIEQGKEENQKLLEDCKKLLNEKDARICFLEENMDKTVKLLQQKESQITQMENSTSWKITEPLRKLKRGEKNEN